MSTIQETEAQWRSGNEGELLEEGSRMNYIMTGIACVLMFVVSTAISLHIMYTDGQGAFYAISIMVVTIIGFAYCAFMLVNDWLTHISLLRRELQDAYNEADVAKARVEVIQADRDHLASLLHEALVEVDFLRPQTAVG